MFSVSVTRRHPRSRARHQTGRSAPFVLFALLVAACGTAPQATTKPFSRSRTFGPGALSSASYQPNPKIAVRNDDFTGPSLNGSTWAFADPVGDSKLSMDGTH